MLVALSVGWVFTRGETQPGVPVKSYQATTYLLSSSTLSSASAAFRGPTNLQTVAALVTIGDVPGRVADAIGYEGDPSELAQGVEVVADSTTGLLSITAIAPGADRATLLADTFAEQLLDFLRERTLEVVRSLQVRIDELDREIAALDRQLSLVPSEDEASILEELELLEFRRQSLVAGYSQLASSTGGNPSGFEILEPATATPVSSDVGLLAPRSRAMRLMLAAIVGLILGVAGALLLERFDTRIQSKEAAEKAYRSPVLGEIPVIPHRLRRSVVAGEFPHAPASNAFRLLAAALQFGRRDGAVGNHSGNGERAWRTILVTSAAPAEGKSTTVANLAATFAEVGKRVIVLCCDFRHPSLHATFGIRQGPGLSDILAADEPVELEGALQQTSMEGVRVLSTGSVPEKTSGLLGSDRMRQVIAEARSAADVVLIDTSPVLAASDWAQLLPEVEAVLAVARAGKTGVDSAERTAEILATLQAPLVGVVLNRLPRVAIGSQRYRFSFGYGGYGDASEPAAPVLDPVNEEGVAVVGVNGEGGETERASDRSATPDGGNPHLVRPSTKG